MTSIHLMLLLKPGTLVKNPSHFTHVVSDLMLHYPTSFLQVSITTATQLPITTSRAPRVVNITEGPACSHRKISEHFRKRGSTDPYSFMSMVAGAIGISSQRKHDACTLQDANHPTGQQPPRLHLMVTKTLDQFPL